MAYSIERHTFPDSPVSKADDGSRAFSCECRLGGCGGGCQRNSHCNNDDVAVGLALRWMADCFMQVSWDRHEAFRPIGT